MGQRLTKREPIVLSANVKDLGPIGTVIDDGTNNPIVLMRDYPEFCAKIFVENLQRQYSKKVWKFWII